MKIIFIWNQKPNQGKNTIALNLCNSLVNKNFIVGFLTTNHWHKKNFLSKKIKLSKRYGLPFLEYSEIYKNFILFYLDQNNIINNSLNNDEIKKIYISSIEKIQNKFDYLIIESCLIHNIFNQTIIQNLDQLVLVYNTNLFASNQIISDLKFIKTYKNSENNLKISCVILNSFDPKKISNINNIMELKKAFGNEIVFTLPHVELLYEKHESSKEYLEKNPWSEYAIKINEITDQLINIK